MEDQLAALGLVLNAVVLWNTRYLDAIVEDLRGKGLSGPRRGRRPAVSARARPAKLKRCDSRKNRGATLKLTLQHVEIHVSSIPEAREFYIDKLGLKLLDETPELDLIAVRAGGVRISLFGGYERNQTPNSNHVGTHIILRTDDLEQTIEELEARGVAFRGEVVEAGGFIKDIETMDPDGNVIEIAEYLRDPLVPAR